MRPLPLLVPHLSSQAIQEKLELETLLTSITVWQQPNVRTRKFAGEANWLDSGQPYHFSTHLGDRNRICDFFWGQPCPSERQILQMLAVEGMHLVQSQLAQEGNS